MLLSQRVFDVLHLRAVDAKQGLVVNRGPHWFSGDSKRKII